MTELPDLCPVDVHALDDGKCPECGWVPKLAEGPLLPRLLGDDRPGILGY